MGRPRNPLLSVVLPTISGREHWLGKALASISETVDDYELLVYLDKPTCGVGWNLGIEEAKGDYVLLFADDLEAHPGWFQAGAGGRGDPLSPHPQS
jgi:glycosyltransferase involved in cell wall biosynthesis